MSTFSAQDQCKMSLLFASFGYLVSTSALTNLYVTLYIKLYLAPDLT